ncbi:MAG: hypothetical protein M1524_02120 [Patescibacteria group bacterium]|nr:hypothetical protein [Patescibacteria group bacterium]
MTEAIGAPKNPEDLDRRFSNLRAKISNRHLSDESAWEEIQPLLSYMDPNYPQGYGSLIEPIRKIFFIRRKGFFDPEFRQIASSQVKAVNDAIQGEEERTRIGPISFKITSLFDTPLYRRKK